MSDTDGQRLVVTLEARINKYERDLAKAQGATNNNFRKMERRTKQSAEQMEKHLSKATDGIADKLSGMFKPFLAGGAVVAATSFIGQFAKSIAEVSYEAEKARVSTKVWQQWTYAAKATGASIDGVTDALKELNIRGDEFAITGKGGAAEAFERLGYSAADVAERLKDPSRFMDEIIGKLQKMDQAAQARNMDELFGGTGAEEMSKMLGLSVDQIQKLRSEAALFTDAQIEAAKQIDARFETMWRNITVWSKQALLETVGYAQQTAKFLSQLKGDGIIAEAKTKALSEEGRMNTLLEKRKAIVEKITDLQNEAADPLFDSSLTEMNLKRLQDELDGVDEKIAELTPHSQEFSAALKELSNATLSLSNGFNNSVSASANFKASLNELKALVPELKKELDELAAVDSIDKAFSQAVRNAKNPAEIEEANRLRNRALTNAKFGQHKNLLDLIAAAEGTDQGRGYNETLAYGKFTGGNRNLTAMTLNEIMALQGQMLAHPDNKFNSSALGRYQITRQTLQDFMPRLGLKGDHLFDETTQDAIAQAIIKSTGGSVEKLRGRWEGLKFVDDAGTISAAYNNTQHVPDKIAPSESQQKAIDLAKQQDDARKGLNQSISEGLALAQKEAQISGLSTSQQRIELELFRAQQELARQGVTLSSQELAALREKITLTEQLKQSQLTAADQADGLAEAQMFFAQSFTSSLSGLLTGTQSLTGALQNMVNALIDAVLQATLLGQGPLASILGGAGSTGLLGSLFGFAEGGFTGQGGKYQPAGIVHRGEYVMSAAATRRLGVGNLERLHKSAKRGYAEGGLVGGVAFASSDKPLAGNQAVTTNVISPNITVNASGGTPDQNNDLAKQISKEVEKSMSAMVAKEISRQQRPGNMIGRR